MVVIWTGTVVVQSGGSGKWMHEQTHNWNMFEIISVHSDCLYSAILSWTLCVPSTESNTYKH